MPDECCCYMSRDNLLHATSEQARAFATVGLLRLISEETPLDMIISYIYKTNQFDALCGFINFSPNDHEFIDFTSNTHEFGEETKSGLIDRMNNLIPTGMRNMAKDYLIRTFWKNIDHLISSDCMRVGLYDGGHPWKESELRDKGTCIREFPKTVISVLDSMHIHINARLWDARNDIGNLHAACTPVFMMRPPWAAQQGNCFGTGVDQDKFDVLRHREDRSISALYSTLLAYCWDANNRKHIPNKAEKDILLDLIESFLIMFGPGNFKFNFRIKDIYEYMRAGNVDDPSSMSRMEHLCSAQDKFRENDFFRIRNGTNLMISKSKYFSPEAALCFGIDMHFTAMVLSKLDIVKKLNLVTYPEVEIYLYTELRVVKDKACLADRIEKAIKRGEFDADKLAKRSNQDDPCCDEPVRSYDCGC